MKKIAVLLAAYNGMNWLPKQVNSILTQQNVEVTLFVSVDSSSDGTENWFDSLANNDKRVLILPHGKNFGCAASNFFRLIRDVSFLNFDYIAFSDQDDIWHTDKLHRAIKSLSIKCCEGYSSNITAFWPNGHEILINKAQPQVEMDYLFESAGPGCTFVMTKHLAIDLQLFIYRHREAMSSVWLHDWFSYAFARSHGYSWYIDKYPSMRYRQHANNQVGVNTGYQALLYRMHFVLSGKAIEQSILIATLCGMGDHPFIKKLTSHPRLGLLYLVLNAAKCRRKQNDRFFFMLSGLLLFSLGRKIQ